MRCLWARPAWLASVAAASVVTAAPAVRAQTPAAPPAAASPAAVKNVVAALQAQKLEAFAIKDPSQDSRFVAVLQVPNLQLIVVEATYGQVSDIEYFMYKKDYQNVYATLRSGVLSSNRTIVEDAYADGLVAFPAKGQPLSDTVTTPSGKRTFDGDVADPKKRNDKRITRDDYLKAFTDADAQYVKALTTLVEGLKKLELTVGAGPGVR